MVPVPPQTGVLRRLLGAPACLCLLLLFVDTRTARAFVVVVSPPSIFAGSPTSSSTAQPARRLREGPSGRCRWPSSPVVVYSSSGGGGGGDDEIAKLVSKRSQIKRKTKEDIEEAALPSEPIVEINLDGLPEFKTERPVRRKRSEEDDDDEADGEGGDAAKAKDASPIVDFMADHEDENEFHIPNRIGVSTRAWGDPTLNFAASGKLTKRMIKAGKFVPGDLQLAHLKLLEGGITFFETSPAYGSASRKQKLSSEEILQRCVEETSEDGLPETMVLASLGQNPWTKIGTNAMANSLEESLSRLGTASVELFQAPKSLLFPSTLLARSLAAALESGQCNHVGVQGVTRGGSLRRLQRKLEARDVVLTSNAFDFALTNTKREKMIDACKDAGVIPLITDPLDGGLASGVYTATNPSGGQQGGARARFTFKQLEKLQPLHSVQETVAERVATRVRREMRDTQERFKSRYGPPPQINSDITTTQVALNYVIAKGGVPLPEVNSPKEAEEVLGCLGWTLSDEEVGMLDAAAALCEM